MVPPRGRGRGGGGRGGGGESAASGEERWLVTYADMITLLLAMFVVFYAMANQDLEKYEALAKSLQEGFSGSVSGRAIPFDEGGASNPISGAPGPTRPVRIFDYPKLEGELNQQLQELLEQRAEDLPNAEVEFNVSERGVAINIHPNELLFNTGEAQLRSDFQPILSEIASALQEIDNPIQIEGHTDSRPIDTYRYPSNWQLSSARASAVLQYMIDEGLSAERMSVAGYGATKPVASNDTAEGRAQNRRVRILILRGGDEQGGEDGQGNQNGTTGPQQNRRNAGGDGGESS